MTTTRVQIVLVTGAGSGFGRATAIELARAGHVVYASMRRDDLEGHSKERWASLRSVASEERLDLRPLELDLQEDASWQGRRSDPRHHRDGARYQTEAN
jgi:NAD(P)-dependent dehydrogenase (short-subunit alcohol dehydrogenase family)